MRSSALVLVALALGCARVADDAVQPSLEAIVQPPVVEAPRPCESYDGSSTVTVVNAMGIASGCVWGAEYELSRAIGELPRG